MLVIVAFATGVDGAEKTGRVGGGVKITDIEGEYEFLLQQRRDNQENKPGGQQRRSSELITEQNIGLNADGYIYHPNLFEFSLGGLFGLSQFSFEDNFQGRDRNNGSVVEFNFDGTFARKKNHPGSVFARRYRAFEPRPFLSSIEQTNTSYGGMWQYLGEDFTTNIRFDHSVVDQDALGDDVSDRRRTNDQLRWDTRYSINDYSRVGLTYKHRSVDEEPFASDFDVEEVILSHQLEFGSDKQHNLDSGLRYFKQDGSFNLERIQLREMLRMKHSETLSSSHQFEWINRTQTDDIGGDSVRESSFSIDSSLRHKLYDNLVTHVGALLQTQELGASAQVDRFGARAGFDYYRNNPWGVLTANYGVNLSRVDRQGENQRITVFDESRTFLDPQPIIFSDPKIEIPSFNLTSLDELVRFQPGLDYTVTRFADQIEIRRVPTGQIADGEAVLIDFTAPTGGSFLLDTISQHFSLRQAFKSGFSPYYLLNVQRQSVSSPDADFTAPEDLTAHLLGLEYRRGGYRASVEYEDHDSSIRPFVAVRLRGDYNHHFVDGASLGLSANWTTVEFGSVEERETTFFTVGGRYRKPITKRLTAEASARYRTMEDSPNRNDTGIDMDLALEYWVRSTEVRASYEFQSFETEFTNSDSSMLLLSIRRRF